MLGDLDSKADKTQTKLDAVNDRMKDALAKINDKSSNFCVRRAARERRGARESAASHLPLPTARSLALALALSPQVYIICIVMLLGLATVVYKMVSAKKT